MELRRGHCLAFRDIYHYQYFFTEAGVFEGMRVFFHQGIGCGKFYTAKDCDSMLLQNEGLNEATVGELRMATSTLQEGAVARVDRNAAGVGGAKKRVLKEDAGLLRSLCLM
jgi:hypothetical protein